MDKKKLSNSPLHYYKEIDSTNNIAKKLLNEGHYKNVVIASIQTAGRGRNNRSFTSPNNGLYLSYTLPRLSGNASETFYIGATVLKALGHCYGEGFMVKWVNDILLNEKKICGILCEGTANGVVAGIGINLNTPKSHFEEQSLPNAGSVKSILGIDCDIEEIATELVKQLERLVDEEGYKDELFLYYRSKLITLGREVEVHLSDSSFKGRAVRLEEDGSLVVLTENGEIAVNFGDVTVRGLEGYV